MGVGFARPVWIDDHDFDITYHVRRSALPSPGSDEQLHELVARLAARPLDKSRPLWEMYLVEGLAKNRVALYTKSHQALINGMTALEIGHVIADRTRQSAAVPRRHLGAGARTRQHPVIAGRAHRLDGRAGHPAAGGRVGDGRGGD